MTYKVKASMIQVSTVVRIRVTTNLLLLRILSFKKIGMADWVTIPTLPLMCTSIGHKMETQLIALYKCVQNAVVLKRSLVILEP